MNSVIKYLGQLFLICLISLGLTAVSFAIDVKVNTCENRAMFVYAAAETRDAGMPLDIYQKVVVHYAMGQGTPEEEIKELLFWADWVWAHKEYKPDEIHAAYLQTCKHKIQT